MSEEIFRQPVEAYLARTALQCPPPHPVLERMRVLATERSFPIVGPEVGRFFFQLAAMNRPRRVLELGSGFGYSALWWLLGCSESEVHLTDFKMENLEEARAFGQEAGVADRMVFHCGGALDTARELSGPWDVIFCDIDKEDYPAALDLALQVQEPGALLLYDNMLWHGRVGEPEDAWDAQTRAVVETTRRLYDDHRWMTSLLPIRDGVLMALRLSSEG